MCRLGDGILMLDLRLLLRMKRLICVLMKWMQPVIKLLCLMLVGAAFLFTYAYVNVQGELDEFPPSSERFDYRKPKSLFSEMLGDKDLTKSCSSALEKEVVRLKTKAFGLESMIRKMKLQLSKFYSRPGGKEVSEEMADFASEAVGGCVVDTPDTESFCVSQSDELTLFGIPIWRPTYHTPRKVIQPWTQAGECWAFKGSEGKIIIDLAQTAMISHVTLEHIPASAALTGTIDSAPKKFSVLGQVKDEFVCIDTFIYNINGPPSQTFSVKKKEMTQVPFKRVLLEIISNWGNPHYTCIYRFKVHGKMFDDIRYA